MSNLAIHHCAQFGNFSPTEFEKRGIEFLLTLLEKREEHAEVVMSEIAVVLDNIKTSLFSDHEQSKEL